MTQEEMFTEFFRKEKCLSCSNTLKAEYCKEFDECSSMERVYFYGGVKHAFTIESISQIK